MPAGAPWARSTSLASPSCRASGRPAGGARLAAPLAARSTRITARRREHSVYRRPALQQFGADGGPPSAVWVAACCRLPAPAVQLHQCSAYRRRLSHGRASRTATAVTIDSADQRRRCSLLRAGLQLFGAGLPYSQWPAAVGLSQPSQAGEALKCIVPKYRVGSRLPGACVSLLGPNNVLGLCTPGHTVQY
jgi:hypothetical protein